MKVKTMMSALLMAGLCGPGVHAQTAPVSSRSAPTPLQTGMPALPAADLTLYSGRTAATVAPIVAAFQQRTGLKVNVVYSSDAELLPTLLAGWQARGADLYWSNATLPLDALQDAGLLTPLPASSLKGVSAALLSPASPQNWLPTNLRYRVLAYSTDRIDPATLPASVLDLPKLSGLTGRVGWAVADPAFQQFLAAMIVTSGEAQTRMWLEGMKALKPRDFGTENLGLMQAIQNGDLDVGLTTHTFVQRVRRASYKVAAQAFAAGDVGNLRDLSGLALLKGSAHRPVALQFLAAVNRPETQAFMLSVNFEYPVTQTLNPTTLSSFSAALASAPAVGADQLRAALPAAVRLLEDADLL